MPLIILFLVIPMIEIAVFVMVDNQIGLLNTLLLCVVTAIFGGVLLKKEGRNTLNSLRNTLHQGGMPIKELFDGACLIGAGAFLMTPGFVTDVLGFLLFIPAFRSILRALLAKYGKFNSSSLNMGRAANMNQSRECHDNDAIDVEYEIVNKKDTDSK